MYDTLPTLARPWYTYRGERRNRDRGGPWQSTRRLSYDERQALNEARKLTLTPGGISARDRHKRLNTERVLRYMAASSAFPPAHTDEGVKLRIAFGQLAPKIGPGRASIHTLHRKIAIAEVRAAERDKLLPKQRWYQ